MLALIYLKGKYCARGDGLEVTYKNNKIGKICTDAKTAERAYGREMADKIH